MVVEVQQTFAIVLKFPTTVVPSNIRPYACLPQPALEARSRLLGRLPATALVPTQAVRCPYTIMASSPYHHRLTIGVVRQSCGTAADMQRTDNISRGDVRQYHTLYVKFVSVQSVG